MKPRPAASLFCLTLVLLFTGQTAMAEQAIDIRFSKDPTSGQETLKAQSVYSNHGEALQQVLLTFQNYADLHPWITEVKSVHQTLNGRTEFVLRFKFPWPVGRRWSRIEIDTHSHNAISWRQVEGSMHANRGQLKFSGTGDNIHVDYSAIISVGIPEPLTRGFKKRFVREFIEAAYTRAADSSTGLILADTSAQ